MNKKGFTLIELMIAISIVAILATIGIISYQKTQSIGRDHRRKQDLKSLQVALELYFQKNQSYPLSDGNNELSVSQNWNILISTPTTPVTIYINRMPVDPVNNQSKGLVYGYTSDGTTYSICINLENTNDKDVNIPANTPCQISTANFYGIKATPQ